MLFLLNMLFPRKKRRGNKGTEFVEKYSFFEHEALKLEKKHA